MKKLFIVFLVVTAFYAYSQDFGSENQPAKPKNLVFLNTGTVITSIGIAQGFIFNGGYETLVIPYFGAEAELNLWIMNITSLGTTVSFKVHILGDYIVDPYIGLGITYLRNFTSNTVLIDLPATVGLNLHINDFFGIKFQGKLYLLSLQYMVTEVDLGIFFSIS